MTKRPLTVNAAAALQALEGAAALGFGVFVGIETIMGKAVDPASAIGVTVLALAGGAGMAACARGLLGAASWSRAPTVLTQLFALPVAWSLWQSEQPFAAIPLGLVAVLTLVLALSPPSTGWLVETFESDETVEIDERAADAEIADAQDRDGAAGAKDAPGKAGKAGQGEAAGQDGAGKRPS